MRGRSAVALALAGFLAVTSSVVWRRSLGSARARHLQQLGEKSAALSAERARLEGEIRSATSRAQLTPVAMRLGLRMPNDSQVIDLSRPRAPER
jgi:DMSO/TMAO reductase YedYZ heme-binding membrane subunit